MAGSRDMGRATAVVSVAEGSSWDREVDVVIVGFGAAGACTAIEARETGAEVLVLERASGGGGTAANSTGEIYLGGGTPVQKDCGFDDDAEEMFKYLKASVGDAPDEAKLELYCEGSVAHFDWLVENGVPFKDTMYQGKHVLVTHRQVAIDSDLDSVSIEITSDRF